jgi:hypothetical protein
LDGISTGQDVSGEVDVCFGIREPDVLIESDAPVISDVQGGMTGRSNQ